MHAGQIDFKTYPKVELHRHLEGSLRFSTLVELAQKAGVQSLEPENLLVKTPMKDLKSVLDKFLLLHTLLQSVETIERITFEAIEDAYQDGIRILELRYSPSFIQGSGTLSFDQIHQAVMRGLAKGRAQYPIAAGLLCTFQRIVDRSTNQRVFEFLQAHKTDFVGADLADDEDALSAKEFVWLFKKIQKLDLPVTIHAGESATDQACQNIYDAVVELSARRIGHGVQITRNLKVLEKIRDEKIVLELCVTSNWLTNAVKSIQEHPIRKLLHQGLLVSINSDDPGVFGIQLGHEYNLLQQQLGFTREDFDRCNQIAFDASFIPLDQKKKVW